MNEVPLLWNKIYMIPDIEIKVNSWIIFQHSWNVALANQHWGLVLSILIISKDSHFSNSFYAPDYLWPPERAERHYHPFQTTGITPEVWAAMLTFINTKITYYIHRSVPICLLMTRRKTCTQTWYQQLGIWKVKR